MSLNSMVPISETIAKALERLFKAGGFALTFGFAGIFLILVANASDGDLKIPLFVVGCTLTFICLFFFLFSNFKAKQVTRSIQEDLPLLDNLQRVSLHIAEFASLTQSFAFKHLASIQEAMETIVPMIEVIPVVGDKAKELGLIDKVKLSRVIVDTTEAAKVVVQDVENAIRFGDLKTLRTYAQKLDEVVTKLRLALRDDER